MKLQDQKAYVVGSSRTQVQIAGVTFSPQSPKSEAEALETAARLVTAWNSHLGIPTEAVEKGYLAGIDLPFEKVAAALKTGDPAQVSKAAKPFELGLQKIWGAGQWSISPAEVYFVYGAGTARWAPLPASNLHRLHAEPSKGNSFDVGGMAGTRWRPLGGTKAAKFDEARAIMLRLVTLWNASEGLPTNALARGVLPALFNAEKQTAFAFSRIGSKRKWTDAEREGLRKELVALQSATKAVDAEFDLREGRLHDCASCLAKEGIQIAPVTFALASEKGKSKAKAAKPSEPVEVVGWLAPGSDVVVVDGPEKGKIAVVQGYDKGRSRVKVELYLGKTHKRGVLEVSDTMLRPRSDPFAQKVMQERWEQILVETGSDEPRAKAAPAPKSAPAPKPALKSAPAPKPAPKSAPASKPAPAPAPKPAPKPVPKVEPVKKPKVEPVKPVKVEPVKPRTREKPVSWAGEIKWFV